ncbi:putative membrane protein [Halalkaliarchaeum sp. AArc-CO]|uniref:MFS transporter n=1 Tax=Halalkaliarchaeum sp. AArc-CO TaxID=2866381 RepID=UPI00217E7F6F|nr:MFS transporter [Halalkaliarchaeum sp. AArc-CO]UWG51675.1 putative membrane protein [Halalkaliarchaeum sp. AArc-CO]
METSEEDGRLVRLYREYVGDPEEAVDIYAGFALFFGGIAIGFAGVVLFLVSDGITADEMGLYAVRQVAAVAGAVGLPALLSGVVVLLPVDRRALYLTGAGSVVCLAAIGLFVWAYPYHWNVSGAPDYSATGAGIYSLGLAGVVAATGAALVAHSVQRAAPDVAPEAAAAGSSAADVPDDGEAVTDEQVRADIERELGDAELSWGGIERSETRRLELNTGTEEIDGRGFEVDSAKTARSSGDAVDDAVSGLRRLQGGEKQTASGSGTDDQASALRELKKQRQQREVEREPDSLFDRIKDRL